jgi:hypothetical protein
MVCVLMERSDGMNAFVMAAELLRTSVWREWVGVKATAYPDNDGACRVLRAGGWLKVCSRVLLVVVDGGFDFLSSCSAVL